MSLKGLSSYANLRPEQITCIGNVRKYFDEVKLRELAESIRENGIIEPLIVRAPDGSKLGLNLQETTFELIAGERRLRAALLAESDRVPVRIMHIDKKQAAKLQLLENVQREDLNAIEEAQAYKALLDEHEYTQEKLGSELGVSQAHIANRIRLLELPDEIQENISREIISASHGRVLAGYKNLPTPVLKKAVEVITEKQIPVTQTKETILKTIVDIGKPLFDDYNNKPEFKIRPCEECEYRVMGRRYSYEEKEYPYCVNPTCWEKKQQEVRQEQDRALADRAQKAAKKGQGVVDLKKFTWNQYEEFQDYKIKDLDLSECQNCEHKKIAKGYSDKLTEACFQPSCFKKKQAAATREKNKQAKNAFQIELERIAVLAGSAAESCCPINIPRQVLVYLAAQILANIQNSYERGKTRYQYVKEKFDWDDGFFKSTAFHSLNNDWEVFRSRLETLSEQQLWEIIFEWPAVAEGLKGIRSWILEANLLPDLSLKEETEPTGSVCRVCGCTDFSIGIPSVNTTLEWDRKWVEPDLCSRCVDEAVQEPAVLAAEYVPLKEFDALIEPEPAPAPAARSYIDDRGWKYKVMGDLADTFKARYQKPEKSGSTGWKGVQSLPRRKTFDEAQEDLDTYARAKGWQTGQVAS